jgi:hypothetical protein
VSSDNTRRAVQFEFCRGADAAATANAIEPAAAATWLETLREQAQHGQLFSSINSAICTGTPP